MKGAAAPVPNQNNLVGNPDNYENNIENQYSILLNLGFNDSEIEMFVIEGNLNENELISRYLEIARLPPYNLNWQNVDDAINALFEGNNYNKHEIANDTLASFVSDQNGGKKLKRIKYKKTNKKTNKKRKLKNIRKTKRLNKRK